jgi:hypothetical protein
MKGKKAPSEIDERPRDRRALDKVNPATEETLGTQADGGSAQIKRAADILQ